MLIKKWIFAAAVICMASQMIYAQTFEMIHDGIIRTYVVYEPNNLEPNPEGYPLVIGLHGTGSNGYQFIATAALAQKAVKEKFIVACPDALINETFTYFNVGGSFEELTGGTDDLGFISKLIDTMVAEYNIDTTRIYVMGFSNGSAMSYRVAAELSHKIAAIGAVSGQMVYEYCNPELSVPIMHFHGLSDPLLPYEGTDTVPSVESVMEIWRQVNDCYSIPYTIYNEPGIIGKKWPSFNGKGDVILYTIQDQEHEWPRTASLNISATDVIWDFLKLYTRSTVTDSNNWYVAPEGTVLGDGSTDNPWDLSTALKKRLIKPGDTVWLKGGTYTGPFVKDRNPAGTKDAPIEYRAMPGQRVILTTDEPNSPVLTNEADYIWFRAMEVTGENITKTAGLSVSGIEQDSTSGVKYINMIVHDWPNGSGFDLDSIGTELTGCISYNNGDNGFSGKNCPNNVDGSTENLPWLRYYDCIAFNNSESGFTHDSESQQLANIRHRGCVAYDNGRTNELTAGACNFRAGGNQFDDNFVMQDCFMYFPFDPFTDYTAVWGSTLSPLDGHVTVENNIFVGGGKGISIDGWDQINFKNNTCYTASGGLLHIGATGEPNNCTIDENTYYQDSDEFLYNQGIHYETLAAWQAAMGWDANSTQIAGRPQAAWINLRVNEYEPDRAHLIIYNWPKTDTVTVNIADLWPDDGRQYQYRIVNVEDLRDEPAVEGTLIDGAIEVPIQGLYAPELACYLVTRQTQE
ncbi:MAG: hypothetical protein JW715_10610 [Sedimentisphaerales bacterium]|nr:hypothetical protein [Sedimentisphaerales bacterium]